MLKTNALRKTVGRSGSTTSSGGGDQTLPPPSPPPFAKVTSEVTSDWIQTLCNVTVIFYTRQKELDARRLFVSCDGCLLRVRIAWQGQRCYDYQVRLEQPVRPETLSLKVSQLTGKVELTLRKVQSFQWTSIGQMSADAGFLRPISQAPPLFRSAVLTCKANVTHDVRLLTLTLPPANIFHVPLGWHVRITLQGRTNHDLLAAL